MKRVMHFVQSSRAVRLSLGLVFLALTGWFLGARAAESWDQASEYASRIDPVWVAVSLPMVLGSFVWFAYGWVRILTKLGQRFSGPRVFQIWSKAQFGKYLPGFAWPYVARIYWTSQEGVPKRFTIISSAVESGLMVLTGGLIALSITVFSVDLSHLSGRVEYLALLAAGVLAGGVLVHPSVLNWMLARFARAQEPVTVTYLDALELLLIYLFRWILIGVGFFFLAKATFPVHFSQMPYILASFTLAWTVGFLAVFAPGGFGVREAILVLLLDRVMPTGSAIVLAALGRLWWIAGEVGLFVISVVLVALARRFPRGRDVVTSVESARP